MKTRLVLTAGVLASTLALSLVAQTPADNHEAHRKAWDTHKAMAASFVDAFVRFAEDRFRPRRTIKLALTCGEETDATFNGVQYLLETEPAALEAGFALNEGGSGALDETGRPVSFGVQVGEKIYQDFTLVATAPGGHSARPTDDNAIARLAAALVRVAEHRFPVDMTAATREFFRRSSVAVLFFRAHRHLAPAAES